MRWYGGTWALCIVLALIVSVPALASPWAEVGDAQLRSDLEILADAGMIDDITTHWPIPWAGIVAHVRDEEALANQPTYVREAARRVLEKAHHAMRIGDLRASADIDITNKPGLIRGFDNIGRGEAEGQVSMEYMAPSTAARLSLGIFAPNFKGGKKLFMPDGSYLAQQIGGAVAYVGYLSHWWGPGWISALSYSNNARPFPQIGIERGNTEAFRSPWLSWLGPWQMEFIVGWFTDPRIATNTYWDGLRFTFNPLPGLQIGIARSEELCGKGHPCKPFATYFNLRNDPKHISRTNGEGVIDLRYQHPVLGIPFEIYTQAMNEDSNPIVSSHSSHLFGASAWIPIGGQNMRLTIEYTDTISTKNIFSFGENLFGAGSAYNDSKYADGMRFYGRALGASLDNNSRLLSLQASAVDAGDRTYTLTLDRAQVSNSSALIGDNPLTTAPVTINMAEFRLSIPWSTAKFDVDARVQNDQLRPKHGFTGAIEAALSIDL